MFKGEHKSHCDCATCLRDEKRSRVKVLWVDDEQHLLDGFKLMLKNSHNVETLIDPVRAYAVAESTRPDVVILDGLRGEPFDGIDIAKVLRMEGHKVGICSGDPDVELEAKREGIPFLVKPATRDEIVQFIEVVREV